MARGAFWLLEDVKVCILFFFGFLVCLERLVTMKAPRPWCRLHRTRAVTRWSRNFSFSWNTKHNGVTLLWIQGVTVRSATVL